MFNAHVSTMEECVGSIPAHQDYGGCVVNIYPHVYVNAMKRCAENVLALMGNNIPAQVSGMEDCTGSVHIIIQCQCTFMYIHCAITDKV